MTSFWAFIYSGNLWVVLLVLFVLSLIFKSWFGRRLSSQVSNDELFPRVKEMLAGKPTRQKITEVKNKLLAEGIEPKRVGRLIAAAVSANMPKFSTWLIVLMIIISVVNIFRGYNGSYSLSPVVAPSGSIVYKNSEQGYELTLPPGWISAEKPQSPGKEYFGNTNQALENNPTAYPVAIAVDSGTTTKNISDPSIQQQMLQSVYTKLAAQNPNGGISENTSAQPPYVEFTGEGGSVKFRSRYNYFFGGGRVYAVLMTAPDSIWSTVLPKLMQVISTFKIDTLPVVDSVYPQIASVGDTLTVKGSNFDPLGGWVGNGWISNPHTFLRIKSGQDSAVLWSGNEPDNAKTSATNQIQVVIPSQVCRYSEAAIGGCPAGGYMQILPGQYILEVDVDGRGNSNTNTLTIQVQTL